MRKQTFIDNMQGRGYDIALTPNGNVTATKGDLTVRTASTSTRRP